MHLNFTTCYKTWYHQISMLHNHKYIFIANIHRNIETFNMTASKQRMEHSTYAMFSHKSLTSKNEFKTCRMHNALLLCAAINNTGQWVIFTTVYTAILTATNPHL